MAADKMPAASQFQDLTPCEKRGPIDVIGGNEEISPPAIRIEDIRDAAGACSAIIKREPDGVFPLRLSAIVASRGTGDRGHVFAKIGFVELIAVCVCARKAACASVVPAQHIVITQ